MLALEDRRNLGQSKGDEVLILQEAPAPLLHTRGHGVHRAALLDLPVSSLVRLLVYSTGHKLLDAAVPAARCVYWTHKYQTALH